MARTVQLWRDDAPPAPMLATPCALDAVNLGNASLLYEQKFDGIRAIAVVEPAYPIASCPAAVAQRQRQGHPVSRDRPVSSGTRRDAVGPGDPRRRDRRTRCPGAARFLHVAAVTDAPQGCQRHRSPHRHHPDCAHRLRPAARGAGGSQAAATGRPASEARAPPARANERTPAGRRVYGRRRHARPGAWPSARTGKASSSRTPTRPTCPASDRARGAR